MRIFHQKSLSAKSQFSVKAHSRNHGVFLLIKLALLSDLAVHNGLAAKGVRWLLYCDCLLGSVAEFGDLR